ncbi:hypothetical protein [Mycolicibacterium mengxianglii]|uniref:hypothetical protein n=1 Tax=Mycolicibacterium mengxianglii TaxID=2736649 RepID=UPI0018D1C641|nr:hypothetical protein [Mycolicibacterium mengxianglii]
MRVSLRSTLIAGVSALAVSSLVAAPVRPTPEHRPAQVTESVQLTAAVAPLTPQGKSSALAEISRIAPQLSAAGGDVAVQNAASDFVDWLYSGAVQWADYLALELAPYALGWLPFGGFITDQIYALYPPIIDFTDSVVYDLINPVLNDPLNLQVWLNGLGAVGYTAVASLINAGINEINAVIDYFLSWLPPLPPIPPWPFSATVQTADLVSPQALLGNPITDGIVAVSDAVAGISHALVNLWYPPAGLINNGVGFVNSVLDSVSWVPLVGVGKFQLNEFWSLIQAEGNAAAGLANDLISVGSDLVANAVRNGIGSAVEDALWTALQSVQTRGGNAVGAAVNFSLDQLQYFTGVWVPHTTNPAVNLPQGPPSTIRFDIPPVIRDVLGPLGGLVPSGTLASLPATADLSTTTDNGEDHTASRGLSADVEAPSETTGPADESEPADASEPADDTTPAGGASEDVVDDDLGDDDLGDEDLADEDLAEDDTADDTDVVGEDDAADDADTDAADDDADTDTTTSDQSTSHQTADSSASSDDKD